MRYFFLLITILFISVSCLRDEKKDFDTREMPVEKYVALLKSDKYDPDMLPPVYEISDIPGLLKYGRDEQLITHYPRTYSHSSSYYPFNAVSVGLTVLWTIEATRLDIDYPSPSPSVINRNNHEKVPLSTVADLYERWWQENKSKTAAGLKQVSPFEGTDYMWD